MLIEKDLSVPNKFYKKHATVYFDSEVKPKACILYFHGGGLLYGSRHDLPGLHKKMLTEAGYCIISFDYPLAPSARLDFILDDAYASVNHFLEHPALYVGASLPYYLWGRSAGAYLALLLGAGGKYARKPAGIISYYGYGFLCDGWFMTPDPYYCTLPSVSETAISAIPSGIHADGELNTHYSVYVYARQTGKWLDLIYAGRQKFFYLDYTLRACTQLPCPLFCAHSTQDTDVPYSEFAELCSRYHPQRFIASGTMHDFDRDEYNPATTKLLEATLDFLDTKSEC